MNSFIRSPRQYLSAVSLITLLATGACISGPAQPSGSASVASPRPLTPAPAAQIAFASQPVSLIVRNAVVSQAAGETYTFEVATDAGFASKLATRTGVAAAASGQTSVQLDPLTSGTYYWHARVEQGGTDGLFSSTASFTIGPQVTITAPVLVAPASGALSEGWPAFKVNNSSRSAGVGSLVYRFEVSTSSSFTSILLSSTVAETPNQTLYLPAPRVAPPAQALFWRVTAIDQLNNNSGPTSAAQSFTAFNTPQSNLATLQGLILWSGVQPPGSNIGRAPLGPGWDPGTLVSNCGTTFSNPLLENLQLVDLLDRGLQPQAAIDWMNANGYPNVAAWYSGPLAFGLRYQYMAAIDGNGNPNINGSWELVTRGNEGGC